MKRFLILTGFTLLFSSLHAKDGDQITLQAGTANVIWTLNSAYFETDWSEAKVEGVSWDQWLESKGPDYVRDWPSDKRKIEEYFLKRFNKKTSKKNGLSLQTSNPNDSYSFVIHLLDVDMGSIGGGVVASAFLGSFAKKSGGVNFKSGFVDIVEVSTGKVVCRLAFKDVRGDSGLNMSAQLILVLEDLHDEIIGFADRFKGQSRPELYVAAGAVVPQEPTNVAASPQVQATGNVSPQASTGTSQQQVAVKLKNGATIKGVLKSFDPLDKIVLLIAGQETTIPMEKVENVDMTQAPVSQTTVATASTQNNYSDSRTKSERIPKIWVDLGAGGFTGDAKGMGVGIDLGFRYTKMWGNFGWDILKISAQRSTKYFTWEDIDIQVKTGARYVSNTIGSNIKIYANAAIGTWFDLKNNAPTFPVWEVGTGVMLTNHIAIGAVYNNHDFKGGVNVGYLAGRLSFGF